MKIDEERFWQKVDKSGDCWLWTAYKFPSGYGQAWFNEKRVRAHRVAYESIKGKMPKDLQLDHLCRVRHCVNPEHLEAVTQRENILRGEGVAAIHARKTHCINGHPLSGDNVYITSDRRRCKTCRRQRWREWHARQL